jgi:hypothetical protein
MIIVFVINGDDTEIDTDSQVPLGTAVQQALAVSKNTGRPASSWQVRNVDGVLMEQGRVIEEFKFSERERLFVSSDFGFGGS